MHVEIIGKRYFTILINGKLSGNFTILTVLDYLEQGKELILTS